MATRRQGFPRLRLPAGTLRLKLPLHRGASPYVWVYLFPTLQDLRAYIQGKYAWTTPGVIAGVIPVTVRRGTTVLPWRGDMVFARTHLGVGIVAHELVHLAFRCCEDAGIKVAHWKARTTHGHEESTTAEECYALLVEDLSRRLWRAIYATGTVTPG